jgi:hypothetical protein
MWHFLLILSLCSTSIYINMIQRNIFNSLSPFTKTAYVFHLEINWIHSVVSS